ncbi:MAG TPA: molybdopterin oxidoreductase, partial [Casimicrobiaceae bacterium]
CELVCPVEASVHDHQGINVQVYNRCVGTRFCSNNCPYKVRRFNFLQYSDWTTESLKGQRNPEVTVRMRGIMEKCNYCLQRIENGRITADKENRRVRDGEVVTACQAVCPTRAITFGDLGDPESAVNKRKASPLDYALLRELNTKPRTTYLAKLRNPNPDLGET